MRYKYIVIVLFTILILLIGARSVFIAYVVILFCYYIFSSKSLFRKILFISFLTGLLIFIYNLSIHYEIPILYSSISYLENLSNALEGTAQDGSLNTRISQLNDVFNIWKENPIIGNGPMKDSTKPIEIQLGYYLSAWGIVGVFIFLSIMLTFFIWANKTSKVDNIIVSNYSKANRLWLIASFFVGMSTPITDQIRVFQIFYLLQGLQYVFYYRSFKSLR